MNAKNYLPWISLFAVALVAGLSATRAQTGAEGDVVLATHTACCPVRELGLVMGHSPWGVLLLEAGALPRPNMRSMQ